MSALEAPDGEIWRFVDMSMLIVIHISRFVRRQDLMVLTVFKRRLSQSECGNLVLVSRFSLLAASSRQHSEFGVVIAS